MNSSTHQRRRSVVPKTICDDVTAFAARTCDFAVLKTGYGAAESVVFQLHGTLVPEPSAFVLLTMGALGMLAYAWRRRRRV